MAAQAAVAAAAATFLTRIAGYVLVKRLKSMPPRLEAALNAVPAAVLTALLQNSVRGNIRRQAWTVVQTHNFPKNTRCLINHFAPRNADGDIMVCRTDSTKRKPLQVGYITGTA